MEGTVTYCAVIYQFIATLLFSIFCFIYRVSKLSAGQAFKSNIYEQTVEKTIYYVRLSNTFRLRWAPFYHIGTKKPAYKRNKATALPRSKFLTFTRTFISNNNKALASKTVQCSRNLLGNCWTCEITVRPTAFLSILAA